MIVATNVEVELELICDECGMSLGQEDEDSSGTDVVIKVDVCSNCLSIAFDDGYEESQKELDAKVTEAIQELDLTELFKASDNYNKVQEAIKLIDSGCEGTAMQVLGDICG